MLLWREMPEHRRKTEALMVRFFPGERERLREAASAAGEDDLSTWVRKVLRSEADRLLATKKKR